MSPQFKITTSPPLIGIDLLRRFPRLNASEGERSILVSYVCLSIFGAWLSYVAEHRLVAEAGLFEAPSAYDIWILISGAIGACASVFLGKRWLGQAGISGFIQVLIATPAFSLAAGLVGGSLALPIYGTMFGPLALIGAFVAHPFLLCVWVCCLLGAHVAHSIYARERDSIFVFGKLNLANAAA